MGLYWVQALAALGVVVLALWNFHLRLEGSKQVIVIIPAAILTAIVGLYNVWSDAPFCRLLPASVKGSVPAMWAICVVIAYGWRLWDLMRGNR